MRHLSRAGDGTRAPLGTGPTIAPAAIRAEAALAAPVRTVALHLVVDAVPGPGTVGATRDRAWGRRRAGLGEARLRPVGRPPADLLVAGGILAREAGDVARALREGGSGGETAILGGEESNDLYDKAVAVVLRDRKASTSYIQRRLAIGYNRAASLIERMEKEGLVGPANHAGKREILVGGEEEGRF